jgi:hypothetical protein
MVSADAAIIFDFDKGVSLKNWLVVNDVVMGGRSSGGFSLNDDGHGVFRGEVSTENNGGFSSLRCSDVNVKVGEATTIVVRLKGDGKQYQLRVKDNKRSYHSYILNFETTGEWQDIVIPLNSMYPSFRGRRLQMENFSSDKIVEIGFLIGNKKNEEFELLLDKIYLK